MFPGAYAATLIGGTVSGMIVGDAMGAVPMKSTFPATSSSSVPKTTADGKAVSSNVTPRQHLYMSAAYVVGAIAVLLLGSRALRDARIG
jgi:hypothetical protein